MCCPWGEVPSLTPKCSGLLLSLSKGCWFCFNKGPFSFLSVQTVAVCPPSDDLSPFLFVKWLHCFDWISWVISSPFLPHYPQDNACPSVFFLSPLPHPISNFRLIFAVFQALHAPLYYSPGAGLYHTVCVSASLSRPWLPERTELVP